MEPLIDPLGDRFVKSLPTPPHRRMPIDIMIPPGTKLPSWKLLKEHFTNEGLLTKSAALYLISQCKFLFASENNIIELSDPLTIVGDIHGQFYDMLKILEIGGNPENTKFLFLGDYVDRGVFSVEVILLLFSLKINFPKTLFLLRGNHESRQMTTFFNFREEVLTKFDLEVYESFMDSFDSLPLVCVVNKKFLAVHGGISPELNTLADLQRINRFEEPPRQGLFCDLLWSDPVDNETGQLSDKFVYNNVRSCSFYFGQVALKNFLKKNGLTSVIRAHEAQLEGYKMHKWKGLSKFPMIITIFSAPNYCDTYNNKGAILKLVDNSLNIQQYNFAPHPYHLPSFLNVFTWSVPFVIEKTLAIMNFILRPGGKIENSNNLIEELEDEIKANRRAALKNKIKTVSRMMKMFKTLREENETVLDLKCLSSDNKIPRGLLLEGKEALETTLDKFIKVREIDLNNEKRPD